MPVAQGVRGSVLSAFHVRNPAYSTRRLNRHKQFMVCTRPHKNQYWIGTVLKLFSTREEADSLFLVNYLPLVFSSVLLLFLKIHFFTRYFLIQASSRRVLCTSVSFVEEEVNLQCQANCNPSACQSQLVYESTFSHRQEKQKQGTIVFVGFGFFGFFFF